MTLRQKPCSRSQKEGAIFPYKRRSRGPTEADAILASGGGSWHNPRRNETSGDQAAAAVSMPTLIAANHTNAARTVSGEK